jgi:hypothetical protein
MGIYPLVGFYMFDMWFVEAYFFAKNKSQEWLFLFLYAILAAMQINRS